MVAWPFSCSGLPHLWRSDAFSGLQIWVGWCQPLVYGIVAGELFILRAFFSSVFILTNWFVDRVREGGHQLGACFVQDRCPRALQDGLGEPEIV